MIPVLAGKGACGIHRNRGAELCRGWFGRAGGVEVASSVSKGARHEMPAVSGLNDAGKDVGRGGRAWLARCGPCERGSGADLDGFKDTGDSEKARGGRSRW